MGFDGAAPPPTGWSVNHFGLRGRIAAAGHKRGDFVTTWRERYFVLHADGNFLVYFLSPTEPAARGVLPLAGATIEPTEARDGCGLTLAPRGAGSVQLALPTAAERDAWVAALRAAAAEPFVDSPANRALLPQLPSLPARAQSVFFGAAGSWASHALGEGLPESWADDPEGLDRQWCILSAEAQFIWLFEDESLRKMQGLVALGTLAIACRPPSPLGRALTPTPGRVAEGCDVMDGSEFELGAGFAADPGESADTAGSTVLALQVRAQDLTTASCFMRKRSGELTSAVLLLRSTTCGRRTSSASRTPPPARSGGHGWRIS